MWKGVRATLTNKSIGWSNGGCNRCVFKNKIGEHWSRWSFCPYCGRKLPKSNPDDSKKGNNSNASPMIKVQP